MLKLWPLAAVVGDYCFQTLRPRLKTAKPSSLWAIPTIVLAGPKEDAYVAVERWSKALNGSLPQEPVRLNGLGRN